MYYINVIIFSVSGNVECGTLLGIMGPRLVIIKYNFKHLRYVVGKHGFLFYSI